MSASTEIRGPFPFSRHDLAEQRLNEGVRHTLAHFRHWRDTHPRQIADHIDQYTAQLAVVTAECRPAARLRRWLDPGGRRRAEQTRLVREAVHFSVFNLAQIPAPATVEALLGGPGRRLASVREMIAQLDGSRGTAEIVAALVQQLPMLAGLPETRWLAERLDHLYRILPDAVVRAGSMGKVVRTLAGVLVIGAADTVTADPAEARARLAGILPAAYAYGAAYAIVDDTLHDLPGALLGPEERQRYGDMIIQALATGEPVDPAAGPDHPLAEEAHALYTMLLERYPFARYRQLYHAAEAMFRAQHRDAARTAETAATGLLALYPDLVIKAGMSRVAANILAGRELDDGFYARCINSIVVSQFRDDLIDRDEDGRSGRLTPFTFPTQLADTNPLYDLFAYHAYVAAEVFDGDPVAVDALTSYDAARLAAHLAADPAGAEELLRRYDATAEIIRFGRTATSLPRRVVRQLDTVDQRLKQQVGRLLSVRDPVRADCRTFVADRLEYLNEVVVRYGTAPAEGELREITAYALAGSSKRLRPALSLMLVQTLGADPSSIEPVLAASELFHTASLLFDDLPAQDGATVRRGRPAAHLVFAEGSVQLAALSMISTGFGLLARLDQRFPAQKVTEVIAYLGTVLGPQRICRGQYLDLRLADQDEPAGSEEILRMYDLKTSTAIEAALVPLMMVLDRPVGETTLVRRYAHHAGIVFQLRDDILDATSSTEALGKDADNDVGKANLVRVLGLAEADRLMQQHLADAVACCAKLPFDTTQLAGMVRYFATRRR